MEVNYSISRSELSQANRYIKKGVGKRVKGSKPKLLTVLVSVILWIPVGYIWAKLQNEYGADASILLVTALALVFTISITNRVMSEYFWKFVPSEDGPSIGDFVLTIGNDNFIVKNNRIKTEMSFKDVKFYGEDDDFVYYFIDNHQAFYFPKEAFDGEKGYEVMLDRLREYT